jgi:hypothetical protein
MDKHMPTYLQTIAALDGHRPGYELRVSVVAFSGSPLIDARVFKHGRPSDNGFYLDTKQMTRFIEALIKATHSAGRFSNG